MAEEYRRMIIELLEKIEEEKFLIQVLTIVRKHIEKGGG